MWYIKKYDTWRPTEKEQQAKLREYQKINKQKTRHNVSEWWMKGFLNDLEKETRIRFKEQCLRWNRIFDFWCANLWIAVEVDWWYHNEQRKKENDEKYDRYYYLRSGILVIRVRPFHTWDIYECIQRIKKEKPRSVRRRDMWISNKGKSIDAVEKYDQKQEQLQKTREQMCESTAPKWIIL